MFITSLFVALRSLIASSTSTGSGTLRTRSRNDGRSRKARSYKTSRAFHLLVIVLRLVVGTTALQITGISHAATDVIAVVQHDDEHAHDEDNCPNDDDGRECPPGCPSCHCAHAMNALPSVAPSPVLDPLIPIEIAIAPYEAQGPPLPEPHSLYRPPRVCHI